MEALSAIIAVVSAAKKNLYWNFFCCPLAETLEGREIRHISNLVGVPHCGDFPLVTSVMGRTVCNNLMKTSSINLDDNLSDDSLLCTSQLRSSIFFTS